MALAALILLAACTNLENCFRLALRTVRRNLRCGSRSARVEGGFYASFFTEAMLISLIGGAIGLWIAWGVAKHASAWRPFPQFPLNIPVTPDARVYLAALVLQVSVDCFSARYP